MRKFRCFVLCLIILLPLIHGLIFSAITCSKPDYTGTSSCSVGIRSEIISVAARESQDLPLWCWAACIQMVFRYYGHEINQASIVKAIWGEAVNRRASINQIVQALNAHWTDSAGRRFVVAADSFNVTITAAANDLSEDMPLIIGSQGHAMVLTALTFNVNADTNSVPVLTNAIVRDPWPGRGKRNLSLEEWNNIILAVRIRIMNFD